jgi:hypothetical protein
MNITTVKDDLMIFPIVIPNEALPVSTGFDWSKIKRVNNAKREKAREKRRWAKIRRKQGR